MQRHGPLVILLIAEIRNTTIQAITDFFEFYAQHIPLELFVLVGTFVEELFSPVPSFAVLLPAGAAAEARDMGVLYLAWLMIFSAIGRICAGTILYTLADKFEDVWLGKGRKILGVSHKQVERFGQRLGKGWKDWALIFAMNAVPIFPGGALSLLSGFVRVPYYMFAICTFFGTMINALIYLSIGYAGVKGASALRGLEIGSQIVAALLLITGVILFIRYRKRHAHADNTTA